MRPAGLAPLTILMCVLNPAGLVLVDGPGAYRPTQMAMSAVMTTLAYVVLWYFWRGHRWAGILVQIVSVIALISLIQLGSANTLQQAVIIVEAALGLYILLYWSRRADVRAFFAKSPEQRAPSA